MADPQSSSSVPTDPPGSARGDARIEQLLVAGLDQYFAGDFESAINLWTRVLFLDRHHDRARAYIERARSAQAERQRQTEALVHEGMVAFDRGDVEHARALLSDAMDRGASQDLTIGVLDRIERLDVSAARPGRTQRPSPRPRVTAPGRLVTESGPEVMPARRFWYLIALIRANKYGGNRFTRSAISILNGAVFSTGLSDSFSWLMLVGSFQLAVGSWQKCGVSRERIGCI